MRMTGKARTYYRLNVTKRKLYTLAKRRFPQIPPTQKTVFSRYPHSRDCALDFQLGDVSHHLFLSVCGGEPTLGDKSTTYIGETPVVDWKTEALSLEELCALDMLERVEP